MRLYCFVRTVCHGPGPYAGFPLPTTPQRPASHQKSTAAVPNE